MLIKTTAEMPTGGGGAIPFFRGVVLVEKCIRVFIRGM